jgi:hypothetical protein
MEKIKYIDVVFPNGEKWRVNAYPVAKECAEMNVPHMTNIDRNINPDKYDIVLNDDIDYLLSTEGFDDLRDYLENFSDWNTLEKKQIGSQSFPAYESWLMSGNFVAYEVME